MEINKNNYEAFFLDYHEGSLTPLQVKDLLLFVELHPELKDEFENYENFSLEDFSAVQFENKSSLKKAITEDNKEEYFIRSVENQLTTTEIALLDRFFKKHPQLSVDFALFEKTKLSVDASIVFENKDVLKKSLSAADEVEELFISAIEGQLTLKETVLFNTLLKDDKEISKKLNSYQQTKFVADKSIIFENKEQLKQKDKKVVPFYYYISVAATLLMFFGLFFLFNSTKDTEFAFVEPVFEVKTPEIIEPLPKVENTKKISPKQIIINTTGTTKNEQLKKIKLNSYDSLITAPLLIPSIAVLSEKEPQAIIVNTLDSLIALSDMKLIEDDSDRVTQVGREKKQEISKSIEFLSISELAVKKIKEKILDKNTVVAQNKSGGIKKITGWDIAQAVTAGISKLTGREVELKPCYNDEGVVTAYALNAGAFQISRGR